MTIPNSKQHIQAGALVLNARDDDPPPDLADVHATDVVIAKQLGDDQLWPMQESEVCTFKLYAPHVDMLASVVEGAPVDAAYYCPRDAVGSLLRFRGRVTDVTIQAHRVGCLMDVTAMEYRVADFAETLVGDEPWPQETISDRVNRIFSLLGLAEPTDWLTDRDPAAPGAGTLVRARDVDAQPALGLLDDLLQSWAWDFTDVLVSEGGLDPNTAAAWPPGLAYARPVLWPQTIVGGAAGGVTQWQLYPRFAAAQPSDFGWAQPPGLFGLDPSTDGYGLTIPADGADRADSTIAAGYVDLASARWSQRRGQRPNQVAVTYWIAGVEKTWYSGQGVEPKITQRISTDLVTADDARRAARLYLPERSAATDWYAEAFAWRWYADDALVRPPELGNMLAVAPVQDRHSPLRRPWYYGMCTGVTFRNAGGRPVVDVAIRPEQRRTMSYPDGGMTIDEFPAGVTWDDLNTRDTWDDYRLLRSAP